MTLTINYTIPKIVIISLLNVLCLGALYFSGVYYEVPLLILMISSSVFIYFTDVELSYFERIKKVLFFVVCSAALVCAGIFLSAFWVLSHCGSGGC